jgi:hypothetical protein
LVPQPPKPIPADDAIRTGIDFAVNVISHPLLWMITLRYDRAGQLITAMRRCHRGYVDLRCCGLITLPGILNLVRLSDPMGADLRAWAAI